MGEAKRKKEKNIVNTKKEVAQAMEAANGEARIDISTMMLMPVNTWLTTDCFMITRVPGGWIYSRSWNNGMGPGAGAHSIFVPEPVNFMIPKDAANKSS